MADRPPLGEFAGVAWCSVVTFRITDYLSWWIVYLRHRDYVSGLVCKPNGRIVLLEPIHSTRVGSLLV